MATAELPSDGDGLFRREKPPKVPAMRRLVTLCLAATCAAGVLVHAAETHAAVPAVERVAISLPAMEAGMPSSRMIVATWVGVQEPAASPGCCAKTKTRKATSQVRKPKSYQMCAA